MKVTRQEAVDMLIDIAFDSDDSSQLLEVILRNGCKGYNKMTNKELEEVYNQGLDTDEQITITE